MVISLTINCCTTINPTSEFSVDGSSIRTSSLEKESGCSVVVDNSSIIDFMYIAIISIICGVLNHDLILSSLSLSRPSLLSIIYIYLSSLNVQYSAYSWIRR